MFTPSEIIANNTFQLVDVTMRDGALGRKFPYSYAQLTRYLRILESIGIKYAEVGFINGPGKWTEEKADSPNYDINPELNTQLDKESPLMIWSMIDSDNPRIKNRHVHTNKHSLIRLTADLDKLHLLRAKIQLCKQKGVPFSVNLKHTGSYDLTQVQSLAEFSQTQGAQIFYIVDTAGTMIPAQVALVARTLKHTVSIDLGFHGHDSLGFAAANSLVAIEAGCTYIDVSLCGIGAGGGNAILETFALLSQGERCDWNKLLEAGKLLKMPLEYLELQERIFWGFIGCNSTVKKDLSVRTSSSLLAEKALEWKYGKVLSKGEHTTLRILTRTEPMVIKIATGSGVPKLMNEIVFLERNKSELHHDFLPDIYSHEVSAQQGCYAMPYVSGPLLRDYMYSQATLAQCDRQVRKVINNLNQLHRTTGTIESSAFCREFYFERLQKRWDNLRHVPHENQVSTTFDVRSIFLRIAQGTPLVISGKIYKFSLAYLLGSLERLRPILDIPQTAIRLIHGDPHYGNVVLHDDRAILLDPNGFLDGGDIAYDFGKLLISYDWHDLSMMHLLEPAKVVITPRGIEVTDNKVYKDGRIEKRHARFRKSVIELVRRDVLPMYAQTDRVLLQRIILLMYIHQFSFAPTLIQEKPETALHILINAVVDYMELEKDGSFSYLP